MIRGRRKANSIMILREMSCDNAKSIELSQELELSGTVAGKLITRRRYRVCCPHATKLSDCQRMHATFKKLSGFVVTFTPTGGVGVKVTDPLEHNKRQKPV
jgi:hypothetical protein